RAPTIGSWRPPMGCHGPPLVVPLLTVGGALPTAMGPLSPSPATTVAMGSCARRLERAAGLWGPRCPVVVIGRDSAMRVVGALPLPSVVATGRCTPRPAPITHGRR